MSTILVLDLESTPTSLPWLREEIRNGISPPGTLKKPESIAKWMEENAATAATEKIHKTAVDVNVAEICVIGFSIDGGPADSFQRALGESEKGILEEFWDVLDREIAQAHIELVTYNGNRFDLPLLKHRSLIHGIKPSRNFPTWPKNGANVFDVMEAWCGYGRENRISMDKLCKLFGIDGKPNDIDGSQVWEYMLAGKVDQVAEYCRGDVERTWQLYQRIKL